MDKSTIGIKIADGTFFPILEGDVSGKKKLVLTTVNDDQNSVQIDLYKGAGKMIADAVYIGSLVIEDIMPALKGDPEIELVIGVDENGNLNAEAGDSGTRERQSLSVSLESLGDEVFSTPNFELDETVFDEVPSFDEEESVLDDDDFEFDEDSGLEDDASFDELPSLDEDLSFDEEPSLDDGFTAEEPSLDDDLSFDEDLDEDDVQFSDDEPSFDDDLSFDEELSTEEPSLDGDLSFDEDLDDDIDEDDVRFSDDEPSFDDDLSFDEELSTEEPSLDGDLSFDEDLDEDLDEDDVRFSDEEPSFDDDLSFDEDSGFDDSDDTDQEPAEAKRERPHRTLALVVLIILILAILGIGAYFIFKSVNGTSVPELQADSPSQNEQPVMEEVAEAEPEPEPVVEAVEAPVVEEPEQAAEPAAPEAEPAAPEAEAAGSQGLPPTGSGGGVWYRLKWGDTLWDLSNSFYRTPWLYKIIAVENDIKNPDVIYAGDDIHIPEN